MKLGKKLSAEIKFSIIKWSIENKESVECWVLSVEPKYSIQTKAAFTKHWRITYSTALQI